MRAISDVKSKSFLHKKRSRLRDLRCAKGDAEAASTPDRLVVNCWLACSMSVGHLHFRGRRDEFVNGTHGALLQVRPDDVHQVLGSFSLFGLRPSAADA